MLRFGDVIVSIDEDQARLQRANFLLVILPIADDNDDIAFGSMTGCSPVQADHPGTTRPGDGVRFQARAVVDVDHLHFFVGIDVGGFQQIGIDGDAANILQVGLGDGGTVNLAFAHSALHSHSSFQTFKVQKHTVETNETTLSLPVYPWKEPSRGSYDIKRTRWQVRNIPEFRRYRAAGQPCPAPRPPPYPHVAAVRGAYRGDARR